MTTDNSSHVELRLHGDLGQLAGARDALHREAAQAGFDGSDCDELGKAFEDVCRQAFLQLAEEDGGLEISIDTFADRLEISIQHRGQMGPVVGLETFAVPLGSAGETGRLNGMELLERVDRVIFNSVDGAARTTLVKLLQPNGQPQGHKSR